MGAMKARPVPNIMDRMVLFSFQRGRIAYTTPKNGHGASPEFGVTSFKSSCSCSRRSPLGQQQEQEQQLEIMAGAANLGGMHEEPQLAAPLFHYEYRRPDDTNIS